jgi:hypothetical protein
VTIEGDYTGKSGEHAEGSTLYGVAVFLPNASLFIKMTGPTDVMAAEKARFVEFCESLK